MQKDTKFSALGVRIKNSTILKKRKRFKRGRLNDDDIDIELEKGIRRFKKKVKDSKVLKICHEKMYFIKPSEIRRSKKLVARYRQRKQSIEAQSY